MHCGDTSSGHLSAIEDYYCILHTIGHIDGSLAAVYLTFVEDGLEGFIPAKTGRRVSGRIPTTAVEGF